MISNEGTNLKGSLLGYFFICKLISANSLSLCNEPKRFFSNASSCCCCWRLNCSFNGRMSYEQMIWTFIVSHNTLAPNQSLGERWWAAIRNKQEYTLGNKWACFWRNFFKKTLEWCRKEKCVYFFYSQLCVHSAL